MACICMCVDHMHSLNPACSSLPHNLLLPVNLAIGTMVLSNRGTQTTQKKTIIYPA